MGQVWLRLSNSGCGYLGKKGAQFPLPGLGPGEDGGPRHLKKGIDRGRIVEEGISQPLLQLPGGAFSGTLWPIH